MYGVQHAEGLATDGPCDLLLNGGRVIDPESGLDALRAVGIRDGKIVHVGDSDVPAVRSLDVSGLVVAPGFIDLHAHAQTINGHRLQALDGVTTALELEAGALPVDSHYAWSEREGRPLNFGFSAGWVYARMHVLDGVPIMGPEENLNFRLADAMFSRHQTLTGWREPATARQVDQILDIIRGEIERGAIGIGALLGYAADSGREEFSRVGALAAELKQPLFVHARYLSPVEPRSSMAAIEELISVAREHGTHVHLCHMNSTSGISTEIIADALLSARDEGLRITTEAYPFGAGSTAVGAEFLDPEALEDNGLQPSSITYLATGERVADVRRLAEIRAADPGGSCLVDFLNVRDEHERALLVRALSFPDGVFASDSVVPTYGGDEEGRALAEEAIFGEVWPLPPGLVAHPRSSGCFSRVFSWLVRETGTLSLIDAVRRSSLLPAQLLEEAVPEMRRKGRVQRGADADLVVFNPASVTPQGGYSELRASYGFKHVFVGGHSVVVDGELQTGSLHGAAVRGGRA